jgi:hypothetical protein
MEHDDGEGLETGETDSARGPEEEPSGNRLLPAFLLGLLAGLVLLGLVWMTIWVVSGDSGDVEGTSDQARIGGAISESPSASASASPGPTRMERCVSAAAALREPLRAAEPAMDQWEVHVGAMNKLVVGAITLQQATAFWNQTRVGAHRQIAEFHHAMAALRRHGVDCPAPGMLAPASRPLRTCARQVAADVQALRAARTSVTTWDKHVRQMEMLRMGMMSPAKASRMWLDMWQRGVDELQSYRAAERAVRSARGCRSSEASGAMPSQPSMPSMSMGTH